MQEKQIRIEDIGPRIKNAREEKNMSQAVLAERLGVGPTHISHIETGKAKPGFWLLVNIMNELEISPNKLFYGYVDTVDMEIKKEIADMLEGCSTEELRRFMRLMNFLRNEWF